jgi:lysophospholipase L1-like esterase
MQVNRDGFRGPDLKAESPNRIAVYGDSYINGEYSDLERTFAVRLAARLAEAGVAGVDAVNAGVNGYGPDQACLRMAEELPRVKPKLVVLSLCNNDFGDLLRNKLFKVGPDGNVRRNNPRIGERLARPFRDARGSLLLDRAIQKVLGGLRQEIPVVGMSLLSTCVAEYRVYVEEGNDEPLEPFSDHYDADVTMTPDSASARYKIDLMAGVLRATQETAAGAGAPLVLLFVPSPADLFDEHETGRVDPSEHPQYRRSALTDAMAEAAKRAGVPYVDLFKTFSENEPQKLYFRGGDDHWSDAGQDLAAEQMAAYLLANGLIR